MKSRSPKLLLSESYEEDFVELQTSVAFSDPSFPLSSQPLLSASADLYVQIILFNEDTQSYYPRNYLNDLLLT